MAFDDIEIEIKYALPVGALAQAKDKLENLAQYKGEKYQKDSYFVPTHENYFAAQYPYKWLRIRQDSKGTSINFKHFYPENVEVADHCVEYETHIADAEQMFKIFAALNCQPLIVVEKTRHTYVVEDKFEIVLDSVVDLGDYLEIEALKDLGGIEATRQTMIDFVTKELGLKEAMIDYRGYPYILMAKQGLTCDAHKAA